MPYCTKCGAKLEDGAKFCVSCGAQVSDSKPVNVAEIPFDFSNVKIRYKCSCGNVANIKEEDDKCPSCGAPVAHQGFIQVYRMGNYYGCAAPMGIYIDGKPYGHLANKESLRVSVPYGTHNVHIPIQGTRKCNDQTIELSPDKPYAWIKARIKAGFWKSSVVLEQADPSTMPKQ